MPKAPGVDAGLNKADIRALSNEMKPATWKGIGRGV